MQSVAEHASALLKTLGHRDRLMILCSLASGERGVGELAEELGLGQSTLSQHLARMRAEGLVATRREAQSVFYRLVDGEARQVIDALYEIFCASD